MVLALAAALSFGVVVGVFLAAQPAHAAPTGTAYDYFVVIDTSRSMIGQGSGHPANIFPKVKKSVTGFINTLRVGQSNVYLYTFDTTLRGPSTVSINSASDKAKVVHAVNGLNATGDMTAIYDSLIKVIAKAGQVRKSDPDNYHVQTVFLFTDGRDNTSGASLAELLRVFTLAHADNPFLLLKYITLGLSAPSGLQGTGGVQALPQASGSVAEMFSVQTEPAIVDFGSFKKQPSSSRVVRLSFDPRLNGSTVRLSATSADAEKSGALVSVTPAQVVLNGSTSGGVATMDQQLTLKVANAQSLAQGATFGGRIALSAAAQDRLIMFSPPEVGLKFNMADQPEVNLEVPGGASLGTALGVLDPYAANQEVVKTITVALTSNDAEKNGSAGLSLRLIRASADLGDTGAVLVGSDGKGVDQLDLPAGATQFAVRVGASPGMQAGQRSYRIDVDPHGATLTGKGLQPSATTHGISSFSVSYSIPPRPASAAQKALAWIVGLVIALIVLALVGLVVLGLTNGAGPIETARLLALSVSPKFGDARLEISQPAANLGVVEMTGKRLLEVGGGAPVLPDLPGRLVFKPVVDLREGHEYVEVARQNDDEHPLVVTRATTGQPDTVMSARVGDGDELAIEVPGGPRYAMFVRSFKYPGT